MQSSYNIIKHTNIINQGNKEIVTNVDNIKNKDNYSEGADNATKTLEMTMASELVQEAREQAEQIINQAKSEAVNIEKEAYENGFSQGFEEGSNSGYSEAYQNTVGKAEIEAENIIAKANAMLLHAKQEYEQYIDLKTKEITMLAIHMAEKVLRRELEKADGLNEMIEEVLSESRNAKAFIIRANTEHAEEIKRNIEAWRQKLGLKSEIFIVADDSLGAHYAIVEKNNGRVEIGLSAGIEGIKQALL